MSLRKLRGSAAGGAGACLGLFKPACGGCGPLGTAPPTGAGGALGAAGAGGALGAAGAGGALGAAGA